MRLKTLLVLLLTTSACAAVSPLTPVTGPLKLSGTVAAHDGVKTVGPIAGAQLTVISGVNSDARVTSDGAGRFAFVGLDPGKFTVSIVAAGYVGVTPVVILSRDTDVTFSLKPQ